MHRILRIFRRTCRPFLCLRWPWLSLILLTLIILNYLGAFTHVWERNYYHEFSYPLEADIATYVESLKHGHVPEVKPINVYNYDYLLTNDHVCRENGNPANLRLIYLVKSALTHSDRRNAIRRSWGYSKRFSDVNIRTVFLLGVPSEEFQQTHPKLIEEIQLENEEFGDLIQADFEDTYFNNTIKTMMGLKWVVNFCPEAKFVVLADDDMYISTKNMLKFIRDPFQYSDSSDAEEESRERNEVHRDRSLKRVQRNVLEISGNNSHLNLDTMLPDDHRLYAGHVFHTPPLRHWTSKWYVSLEEYPFHLWPPYVTAGTCVMSRSALMDFYYASMYTKHFRFDDIFLGLIARKMNIEPLHSSHFYFWKKHYTPRGYSDVMASHGYHDPSELTRVWQEQKSIGSA
uniref:Hexosyltransferase n=1 Tax=Lynceus sp. MCZ IZ 141354 TaxID=1930659 RepID=A0A9N6ZG01_9CRUS|nr:EOG090X07IA [Lynceus sp. MCZ IZ 141354]